MKNFMYTIAICCFTFLAARAQPGEKLLPAYYAIHLALVNADTATAAEKAGVLVQAAAAIPLTDAARATLAQLMVNARKISVTSDLDVQRISPTHLPGLLPHEKSLLAKSDTRH
jgi:hypothetical protein